MARKEAAKLELLSKYKQLCSDEHKTSATGLFGDNLQEDAKALDATKSIVMTVRGKEQGKGFLSKGRGVRTTTTAATTTTIATISARDRPPRAFTGITKEHIKKNLGVT